METYKGWDNVPENFKTKTQLQKMDLKPKDLNNYVAYVKYYSPQGWKETVLYHIDDCDKIKKRIVKIDNLKMDDKTLAEALYNINKSAKISRDTKQEKYYDGDYATVSRSKQRQYELYDLKDNTIQKLVNENRIKIVGYHEQESYDGDIFYLVLYRLDDFTFHAPITEIEAKKLKKLGKIGVVPADRPIKTSLKFNQSVALLKKYLEKAN